MGRVWQLQDAKNRFSEVVDEAAARGPQIVTRRGRKAAVVMSIEDFEKLVQPEEKLSQFLARSPLKGIELDLERSPDRGREIEL